MKYLYLNSLFICCLLLQRNAASTQTPWIDSIRLVSQTQQLDTNKLHNLLGLAFAYKQFQPDSSVNYALKSLALSEKLDFPTGIFESEAAMAQSLMIVGNYPLALEYCFKAKLSAGKLTDTTAVIYADFILSNCYYYLGDYSTSLTYLRGIVESLGKPYADALYKVWPYLSRVYQAMHQCDTALLYAKKAYNGMLHSTCARTEYQFKCDVSEVSPLLANAFAANAVYDSAIYYYHQGIPASRDVYMQADMIDGYNGLAALYHTTGNEDSAVWYAQQVMAEKLSKAYPLALLKAAGLLANIYESQSRPDSSLKYLKIAVAIKDSLFNNEKAIAVQNLTYKEQEKQKAIVATKEKVQNRFRFYFAVAALIAGIIITSVVLRNRREKQLQYMRNSIADDLHDDIGSTLSSISIMSELAKQKSPGSLPLLQSIGESTTSLQENMSDIVWAINPQNDRFTNILQRMTQFASEILDAKNIELDFTNDASLSTVRLTMGQRKNFYLFFKEVINNAAKYSDAKKLSVSITRTNNHLEMNISDDGKGFDPGSTLIGNGMNSLRKRGAELKGYFDIQSQKNQGTCVLLKFRIT